MVVAGLHFGSVHRLAQFKAKPFGTEFGTSLLRYPRLGRVAPVCPIIPLALPSSQTNPPWVIEATAAAKRQAFLTRRLGNSVP